MVSTEHNKATVLRFFNAIESAFDDTVNALVSHDCEVVNVVSSARGRQAFFQSRDVLEAAFSDLRITVQDVVAHGDKVVVRTLWSGVHRGQFLGIDPPGQRAQSVVIIFLGGHSDQIVSWWSLVDRYAIVEQLN